MHAHLVAASPIEGMAGVPCTPCAGRPLSARRCGGASTRRSPARPSAPSRAGRRSRGPVAPFGTSMTCRAGGRISCGRWPKPAARDAACYAKQRSRLPFGSPTGLCGDVTTRVPRVRQRGRPCGTRARGAVWRRPSARSRASTARRGRPPGAWSAWEAPGARATGATWVVEAAWAPGPSPRSPELAPGSPRPARGAGQGCSVSQGRGP